MSCLPEATLGHAVDWRHSLYVVNQLHRGGVPYEFVPPGTGNKTHNGSGSDQEGLLGWPRGRRDASIDDRGSLGYHA